MVTKWGQCPPVAKRLLQAYDLPADTALSAEEVERLPPAALGDLCTFWANTGHGQRAMETFQPLMQRVRHVEEAQREKREAGRAGAGLEEEADVSGQQGDLESAKAVGREGKGDVEMDAIPKQQGRSEQRGEEGREMTAQQKLNKRRRDLALLRPDQITQYHISFGLLVFVDLGNMKRDAAGARPPDQSKVVTQPTATHRFCCARF